MSPCGRFTSGVFRASVAESTVCANPCGWYGIGAGMGRRGDAENNDPRVAPSPCLRVALNTTRASGKLYDGNNAEDTMACLGLS